MFMYNINICNHIVDPNFFIAIICLLSLVCFILVQMNRLKWIRSLIFSLVLVGILGVLFLVSGFSSDPKLIIFSYPLIITYWVYLVVLGTLVFHGLWNMKRTSLHFLCIHLGIWLVSLTLGAKECDKKEFYIPVMMGKVEWRGVDLNDSIQELPIAIKLINIRNEDKVYADISIFTREIEKKTTISINNPFRLSPWKIYYNESIQVGKEKGIYFKLVSSSWDHLLLSGMCLLGIGCIIFVIKKKK